MYSRRAFLRYVGCSAAALGASRLCGPLTATAADGLRGPAAGTGWSPVPYPVPLPGDPGSGAEDRDRLANFVIADDLILPPETESRPLAVWGEEIGTGSGGESFRVGFNCDFVGLIPMPGRPGEAWMIVNHEYISARPWLQGYEEAMGRPLPPLALIAEEEEDDTGRLMLAGRTWPGSRIDQSDLSSPAYPTEAERRVLRALCEAAMDDLGCSILHVRETGDGWLELVRASRENRKFSGIRAVNGHPSQPFRFSGPAAAMIPHTRGTFANCGGCVTPWGTFLTCEENFQNQVPEDVGPDGQMIPGRPKVFEAWEPHERLDLPKEFNGLGFGLTPLVEGRAFGWVAEIDPRTGTCTKRTGLGRFRHENVALRVEAGKPLTAYMGEDRRGGHLFKFVSRDLVSDPADPANGDLFDDGTLYVARFEEDYSGTWIPLGPDTPLRMPEPGVCARGMIPMPRRPGGGMVAVVAPGTIPGLPPEHWRNEVEAFTGKRFEDCTLGDLVTGDADPVAVILLDAFGMANAAGGTPLARPEDVEVHPEDGGLYIAFTDAKTDASGSPDARIFPAARSSRSDQYGAIYRVEDGAGPDFGWGKFVTAGEWAEGGGGFICADNLAFDSGGGLWMMCDISTGSQNQPLDPEDRLPAKADGNPGMFGNNALFQFATSGPDQGLPRCFATGPTDCEMTGLAFTPDERFMVVAVQHPGEYDGARPAVDGQPAVRQATFRIADRDGRVFEQDRTIPVGSSFGAVPGSTVPRPSVMVIRRRDGRSFSDRA